MKPITRYSASLAAVLGIFLLASCSSNKSHTETPTTNSQSSPQATTPSAEAEHGESAETVAPAGTTGAIWTQIGDEETKLSTAIQNGQLKDVHHLAFAIRDLVVGLAEKANAASPATAPTLNGMVDQVKASATKLDELGDAGNLNGTQAEFAKLQTVLGSIKSATGGR